MRHLISVSDLEAKNLFDEIIPGCASQIDRAKALQSGQAPIIPQLHRKATIIMTEPSTRTGGSYEEAAQLLGWRTSMIKGAEAISLVKKESWANTVRIFASQGATALVIRTKIEGVQRFASEILEAQGYKISVQNAGDGTNQHPSQTCLDLLTISQKLGRLDDFKIGFFGDLKYGRTVHSLLQALSLCPGVSITCVSDPEVSLPYQYYELFEGRRKQADRLEDLRGCQVVYGTRLQEERFVGDQLSLKQAQAKSTVTRRILDIWGKDVIVMHPMPYVWEFTTEIRHDPRLVIDFQAWLGMPTRMFLLEEGARNMSLPTLIEKGELEKISQGECRIKPQSDYFQPINNGIGTIIDHLPLGLGGTVREFVSVLLGEDSGVKHVIEGVPSRRKGRKDVVVLRENHLSEEVILNLAALAPEATFNLIANGQISKIRAKKAPGFVIGIGHCPNNNCITNNDPEAKTKFKPHNGEWSCVYCEKVYKTQEIL